MPRLLEFDVAMLTFFVIFPAVLHIRLDWLAGSSKYLKSQKAQ